MLHLHAIDVSNWIHRAYHVAPALSADNGYPTGATKVFISMVESLVGKLREDKERTGDTHVVVFAADAPRTRTWRYRMVRDWADGDALGKDYYYKAKRTTDREKTESLRLQIKLAFDMLECAGFPILYNDTAEADDILATLAYAFRKKANVIVHLHTRDKDCAQLMVYPNVWIEHPKVGNEKARTLKTREDCIAVYGVPPESIVDYLVMLGDSADNIPGIPGIGEAKAVATIEEYGTLAAALADPKFVKRFKSLRENSIVMPIDMMSELIELDHKVEGIPSKLQEFARAKMTTKRSKALRNLKNEYQFNSLFGA